MAGADERWVVKACDQRAIDERAVASGVGLDVLMESAGTNAADWILERLRPRRVVVLAGPGGNGGDAFVVARCLHRAGVEVACHALVPVSACSPATRRMSDRLEASGAEPIRSTSDNGLKAALHRADCAVDGLFGSGLTRPLSGEALRVVGWLNGSKTKTVSLDLPSGLASDAGEVLGEAVHADVTLAMAFLKPAHLLYPAAGSCGNTLVVDVAYPESALRAVERWSQVCERGAIRRRLPERRPDGHKGTFGRILVIAGSIGMTGAAILCCRAALRAGAGLVSLAVPASLDPILETALPEVITIPLPDEGGCLVGTADVRFDEAIERADVLAVGPGLSRAAATLDMVRATLDRFAGPIVLDADGLHALVGHEGLLGRLAGHTVLTPHPGELGALTGLPPLNIDAARRDRARAFASAHGIVLVLKGRPTAIGLPSGKVYLNPTGNDGLATGGSGDVLTGLIAGFAAGGASLADAALVGTYVHGLAAEVYARDCAPRTLIPSDLIERIPEALREIEG